MTEDIFSVQYDQVPVKLLFCAAYYVASWSFIFQSCGSQSKLHCVALSDEFVMALKFSPDNNFIFFPSSLGRVTPEQLCSYMQLFRSKWGALESHCGVLQLGLATAQMLRHPSLSRWDACLAFERLLLQVWTHLIQTCYLFALQPLKRAISFFF